MIRTNTLNACVLCVSDRLHACTPLLRAEKGKNRPLAAPKRNAVEAATTTRFTNLP